MAGVGGGVCGGGYKNDGDEGDEGVLQAAVQVFAKLKVPRIREAPRGSRGPGGGLGRAYCGSRQRHKRGHVSQLPAAAFSGVPAPRAALGLRACCLRGPRLLVPADATRVLHLNLRTSPGARSI